jgi:ribosome-associated protein
MRSQGAGGQNVNKVSSAIHLRFHIPNSSLPTDVKVRLLALKDSRITRDGAIVIKAQSHRSQELNRLDAFARLNELVNSVARPPKTRHATKPSFGSRQRRLETKRKHSETKALRGKSTL